MILKKRAETCTKAIYKNRNLHRLSFIASVNSIVLPLEINNASFAFRMPTFYVSFNNIADPDLHKDPASIRCCLSSGLCLFKSLVGDTWEKSRVDQI